MVSYHQQNRNQWNGKQFHQNKRSYLELLKPVNCRKKRNQQNKQTYIRQSKHNFIVKTENHIGFRRDAGFAILKNNKSLEADKLKNFQKFFKKRFGHYCTM